MPQPWALGTSLGTGMDEAGLGHGPVGGPGSVGPTGRQGRAVGGWNPALLLHCWGKSRWLRGVK